MIILLKDGIRYTLWTPKDEVKEFEPMIIEHIKDIFGDGCLYFPKQKIKTPANNRSIPDGFVVDYKNRRWYIVEIKLLCDDAIRRIRDQLLDYKTAIENTRTRRDIYKSIKSIKPADFLDDLINDKDPKIVVIINRLGGEQGERFKEKVYNPHIAQIVEFKTFIRENVGLPVHIHSFEPLFKEEIPVKEIVIPRKIFPVGKKRPSGETRRQIIMVIEKMNQNIPHQQAFKEVADELGVTQATVRDKCTRGLGINTAEFTRLVKNKKIAEMIR